MPSSSDNLLSMARYPARPSVVSVLRSSTLLNALSEADHEELAAVCHASFAERGEILWQTGADVDFFGLVGVGFVKMVRSTPTGYELTQELMGPGQIFGLLGALDGSGCPLSARAVTHLWYVKIPRRQFVPIYERTMALRDHVIRRTTLRLRQAHDQLARMSVGTVEARVAGILCLLSESYGRSTPEGLVIDVPLTRQDIAEMAGTTVESTIRVVSKWQKSGLVHSNSRYLTLVDPARLVGLAAGT